MIVELNAETIASVKNSRLKSYAMIYLRVQQQFMESVRATGLEVDDTDNGQEYYARLSRLAAKRAIVRNDGKSVFVNRLSTSCAACQTGLGTATFFLSLKCHRACFFCFNPNQEDYTHFVDHQRDCLKELEQIHASQARLEHIGLTGGEPLLHKAEAVEFFRRAHSLFPNAHTRLYTSGDHLDAEILEALQAAHLQEIRFSIRLLDSKPARRHTLAQIALARTYIPNVMVEMPVLPGTTADMQAVILELDGLGIFGINLLEFCFPLSNAQAFRERGYRIKARPYRVLYNYGYAGGLPIAGSEAECLDLVEYALDAKLGIGVHYCSLENKHTGEIYQHHYNRRLEDRFYLSPRDYFVKSAKAFGKDVPKVLEVFEQNGYTGYSLNREHHYVEFHVNQIASLGELDVQVGLSTNILEDRPDGEYLRELQVDLTTPQTFDLAKDV